MSVALQKEELARVSRELHAAGWVANHDGNVTVRLDDGRLLATPTAVSKRVIQTSSVITLDAAGKKLEGDGGPFSELVLHLAAYEARPDVHAVVHAHPPTATGLGVAGVTIDPTILAEPVVSIGDEIPLLPYAAPGSPAFRAQVLEAMGRYNVVVLANHGVLSVGADLEQAFLRLELVEHLAKIMLVARQAGQIRTIPATDTAALLEKRRKAGLDPATTPAASEGKSRLERIVEEEIQRALRR